MILYVLVTHVSMPDDKATHFLRMLSAQLYEFSSEFKRNPQQVSSLEEDL